MPTSAPSPPETLRRVLHKRTQSSRLDQRWTNDNPHNARELSPPLPAALTSRPYPRSIPLCAEEESHPARQTRTHQRSFSELLPRPPTCLSNPTSPNRSPIKEISQEEFEDEFMPTLTGDKSGLVKVSERPRGGGISSWFTGASAPVPLGLPLAMEQAPVSPTANLQKRHTTAHMESNTSVPATPASTSSMFGGFFSSPKPKSPAHIQVPWSLHDEYLTLDIDKALFPAGQPDPFSPSAFKNLLINAEGTLLKLQTAYKLRTIALHELAAEKEAQAEENEETEIRAQSLKNQLEDMSQQLASKDATIKELAENLAKEKALRAEEALAREKSITLIKTKAKAASTSYAAHHTPISPTDSEDLGFSSTTPTRPGNPNHWRTSYGSTDISEDDEPPAVFSRSMSPTTSLSTMHSSVSYTTTDDNDTSSDSRAEVGEASIALVVQNPKVSAFSPQLVKPKQQQSTFQKVLSRSLMGGERKEVEKEKYDNDGGGGGGRGFGLGLGEMQCSNCEGGDARSAWDTVGLLKAENKGLKEQLGRLEEGLDGALDAVLGFGFGLR